MSRCSRCDAAAIQPYISGLGLTLDADGNGSLGALSDGMLILRFLFGFDDAALTNGAVARTARAATRPRSSIISRP